MVITAGSAVPAFVKTTARLRLPKPYELIGLEGAGRFTVPKISLSQFPPVVMALWSSHECAAADVQILPSDRSTIQTQRRTSTDTARCIDIHVTRAK